jgi:transposase
MIDKRYKVNDETIELMKKLRGEGHSYKRIADHIGGISWATVQYWVNSSVRFKSRIRNAKRRHDPEEQKERTQKYLERRKEKWKNNPELKLEHEIKVALNDRRCKRKTVRGYALETARTLMETNQLHKMLETNNKK